MIHELRDQPRLRAAIAGAAAEARPGLQVLRIGGRQPLDLEPPTLVVDEAGGTQELPASMPAQAGAPLFLASLAGATVATAPRTLRAYLLSAQRELVVDSVDDSPSVWRRAEGDWRSLARTGTAPMERHRDVLLLGGQRGGYWHWWIDILPRVWVLDTFGPPEDAGIALATPAPAFGFQREALNLLNLMPRLELLEPGLTRFPRVTFTRGLSGGGSRYPSPRLAEYAQWLQKRFGGGRPAADGGRKLFVSRRAASWRRVINEAEIQPVLDAYGFEIVDPAGMPLADQIAMFSNADAVVGPHGAGLTNLLFARPGTRVVEIFSTPSAQGVSNYRVIASHLRQPYSRLSARAVTNRSGHRPHFYDMHVDRRLLERVLAAIA